MVALPLGTRACAPLAWVLHDGNAKPVRFHAALRTAGITRPFPGHLESWSYAVPDDTRRAGAHLRDLGLSRCAARESM
jgi:mitochondrial fission protein ELM1